MIWSSELIFYRKVVYMSNKDFKPKKDVKEIITKMKEDKGITFKYIDEQDAQEFLSSVNNYLRTASYRKNYRKYTSGEKTGKYIELDFAYLVELSIIDMHYRFLVQKMCSDIEHSICVQLINSIEKNEDKDGYDVAKAFLDNHRNEIKKIASMKASSHPSELLDKYFTIRRGDSGYHTIENYDDCPIWVLLELLSFGSIITIYSEYYESSGEPKIPIKILNLVKSLRNSAAHNNCLLFNLNSNTTVAPREMTEFIKEVGDFTTSQRQKRLSSRAVLEFVALIYVYDKVVKGKVKKHRYKELESLINGRMKEKAGFFKGNELIIGTYKFVKTVTEKII